MSNYSLKNTSTFVKLLCVYFCSLILGAMNIGSFGSLLKAFAIVVCIYGLFGLKSVFIRRETAVVLLYVLIAAFSILYSANKSSSVTETVSQVTFLLFVLVVAQREYNDDEIHFMKKSLVLASRISAVIVILYSGRDWTGRLFLKGVITENANYIPAYFIAGAVFAVQIILSNAHLIRKALAVIEMGIYLFLVLELGSRGGMLALIAAAVLAFLYNGYKNKASFKTAFRKALLIAVVVIGVPLVMKYVNPEMVERFTVAAIYSSNGTGRYDIWKAGMRIYSESGPWRWIFGFGIGSTPAVLQSSGFSHANVMHNCFLEALFEMGLVGFCAYTAMIWHYCKMAFKQKDAFGIAVIVGIIALSMSCSITHFKPYWNIMLFIICQYRRQSPEISEDMQK